MRIFYSKEIMYLRKTFCLQIFAYGNPSKTLKILRKSWNFFRGFCIYIMRVKSSQEGYGAI